MAAQKEEMLGQLFDLMHLTYEKAKEIFAQELPKNNYSMAHAVQMTKLMMEGLKLVTELEKVHKEAAENAWTEEDDRAILEAMEELDAQQAEEAAEFFEEETRRKMEEEFERQWWRKKEEEERGSEGAGEASA